MLARSNITTTDNSHRALALCFCIAALVIAGATPIFAHGGFDHVRGTVVKVSNNVLTINTAKGDVDVRLDKNTQLTQNKHKAQIADLVVGARVIAEVPQHGANRAAQSVKIGVVTKKAEARVHGSSK